MLHNEKRFDPHRQHILTSPERLARWNPLQFLARFGIQPGQTVLDVGSGPGFWTLPLTEIVGPTGQVWALDGSQELLDTLARSHPPSQLRILNDELPDIKLADHTADFAWVAFVFHEVEPSDRLAAEIKRVIKSGGRVAVLDWRPDAKNEEGPPRFHRVAPAQVISLLQGAGFTSAVETWQDDDNYLVEAVAA